MAPLEPHESLHLAPRMSGEGTGTTLAEFSCFQKLPKELLLKVW